MLKCNIQKTKNQEGIPKAEMQTLEIFRINGKMFRIMTGHWPDRKYILHWSFQWGANHTSRHGVGA